MKNKRLCYSLCYTGNDLKILARTVLFYEFFKSIKRDIVVLVDSEKSKEIFERFDCKTLFPPDIERYYFESKRYPNIFLKFAVYELKKFGYTHCVMFDTDVVLGNENLLKHLKICENEILLLKERQIACHKYRPQYPEAYERAYDASCVAFNIEVDIRDILLGECKDSTKTEEWNLCQYDRKYHLLFDMAEGLLTNEKDSKIFTIFHHTFNNFFILF